MCSPGLLRLFDHVYVVFTRALSDQKQVVTQIIWLLSTGLLLTRLRWPGHHWGPALRIETWIENINREQAVVCNVTNIYSTQTWSPLCPQTTKCTGPSVVTWLTTTLDWFSVIFTIKDFQYISLIQYISPRWAVRSKCFSFMNLWIIKAKCR